MTPVATLDLAVNAALLLGDAALVAALRRWPHRPAFVCAVAALLALIAAGGVALALTGGGDLFAPIRAAAWVIFGHGPVCLLLAAGAARRAAPAQALALALAAVGTVGVGVDAFLVEPRAVETTYHQVESAEVDEWIRIVVLADLQVERVTDRERAIVAAAMAEEPDLILLPGDYLQLSDAREDEYLLESVAWKDLIGALDAPLGVYAARGNTEVRSSWASDLFGDTAVTTFRQTASVDLGPIALTGLSFWDGFDPARAVDDAGKFHVAFAHGPDFSRSEAVRADLLVAGHTHGGQVRLPFLGPLVTLSGIPRHHAAGGLFPLSGGRHLVVSRGLGLERGTAPPLRFLCRPEIVVIDVVPPDWVWEVPPGE